MKESQVLVIGLSNCCTELARHLILSGINLQLCCINQNQSIVAADDYLDEFLVTKEDATKKKGEVIVQKLSEMNPYAKITYSETTLESLKEFLASQKFSAVVFGIQGSLEEAI